MPEEGQWIEAAIKRHQDLTNTVVTIIENLLRKEGIDYLAVSGRTKDITSIKQKVQRKGYKDPERQMTDISGVRVIVYLESDVAKVSRIIEASFRIDRENSSNKDTALSPDQNGYRSVHYVCDLGPTRGDIAEYSHLGGLKVEIQVRTVLQHAWAELSHDRKYKFFGKLPQAMERQLFLFAGMLEVADKGLDNLSAEMDEYLASVEDKSAAGNLDIEVNSLTLPQFMADWSKRESFPLKGTSRPDGIVEELRQFGVTTLQELNDIIPKKYAATLKKVGESTSIYGAIRDWMTIADHRKLKKAVKVSWTLTDMDAQIYATLMSKEDYEDVRRTFEWEEGA